MIIDMISDLHGCKPALHGGDLLIVAGDLTGADMLQEYHNFNDWLMKQNYPKKIIIAGNHDGFLQREKVSRRYFSVGCYLQDSMEEYEGLKIWGSPWTPTFYNWHFMLDRGEAIKAKCDLIPDDIDILVTHCPPWGILDTNRYGEHCGCEELRKAVERVKPKLHVFGHIHHEGCGTTEEMWGPDLTKSTIFVNAAHMNEDYEPVNKPIRIQL